MLLLSSLAFFIQPDLDLISFNKPEINISMPSFRKTPEVKELEYIHRIDRDEAKIRYEKGLLPESGYQTKEKYEEVSSVKDKSKNSNSEFKPIVQDKDMLYIPQPKYKLVRYNNPPGSQEINLHRQYRFDREEISYGVISNDMAMMAYPVVHYYAERNVTAGDIFILPLDKSLSDIQRILKANVARRWQTPIMQTDRSTDVRNSFRTITPIDFSPDLSKLIAKEKIGNSFDGIWQTNLWVYDFNSNKAIKVEEIREAILHFWQKTKGINLEEYRWDIYPLGFDKRNSNRILINAYAYTGKNPLFLGAWSVDCEGEVSKLESLTDASMSVSVVGYKLKQDGVRDPNEVKLEIKGLSDTGKFTKKEEKKAKNIEKELKKQIYKKELKQINDKHKEKMKNLINTPEGKGSPTS